MAAHLRVIRHGSIGAIATTRLRVAQRLTAFLAILFDDVVGARHSTYSRGHLRKQVEERSLSENVHVAVITVEYLSVLRGKVHLVRRHGLLINCTKQGNKLI